MSNSCHYSYQRFWHVNEARYFNEDNTLFLPIGPGGKTCFVVGYIVCGSTGRSVLTDGIKVAEGGRGD